MSNRISVWVLAISFLWLASCHRKHPSKNTTNTPFADSVATSNARPVIVDTSSAASAPAAESAPSVSVKETQFEYLVAKSKFSFKGKSQDFDNTNVNIRMKKDSVIWISVTGIGLEVGRGVITKDSIVFMDKIHKDYFVFNYEQLSKQYNFDLDFPLLQAIIVGNLPFPQQSGGRFVKENDFYILKQIVDRLEVDNYVAESNLKLSRLLATEVPTQNTFTLDYDDFRDVKGSLFPFLSQIILNVKSQKDQLVSQTTMRIKHNKVDLVTESPGFPFSVPSSYKRKR